MTVVAARLLDRVGKGMRAAPRDALIADVTPEAIRGAAFGLRQSLDTAGETFGFFSLVSGVAMLVASVLAGRLWDRLGPAATFHAGAGFCVVALVGVAWRQRSSWL